MHAAFAGYDRGRPPSAAAAAAATAADPYTRLPQLEAAAAQDSIAATHIAAVAEQVRDREIGCDRNRKGKDELTFLKMCQSERGGGGEKGSRNWWRNNKFLRSNLAPSQHDFLSPSSSIYFPLGQSRFSSESSTVRYWTN